MSAVEAILELVSRLEPHEQAELQAAMQLRNAEQDLTEAQIAEVKRRIQDVDEGRVQLVEWEDVKRRVREAAAAQRLRK